MESSDRLHHYRSGGGARTPSTERSSSRARSTSSTPRSWARTACSCGASRRMRIIRPSRKCGRTCARTRSGTRSATPSKTRTLTLYLVLDEAHRGMGNARRARRTTSPPSSNGSSTAQAACRRFRWSGAFRPPWSDSTRRWQGRRGAARSATWSWTPPKVQESGLLKDTIVLDIPDEGGRVRTVLVRRATDKMQGVDRGMGRLCHGSRRAEET